MEKRFYSISSQKNPSIKLRAAAGHFATGSSHISHYLDISELKSRASSAKDVAKELAVPYFSKSDSDSNDSVDVDVIVCMEGTEIIAAYLAEELMQGGINSDGGIQILTPVNSTNGNFIFYQNVQEKILNKNVLLMVATMSTGMTVNRALDCLKYYGGKLIGISAIFSAFPEVSDNQVHSLFSCEDIPDYYFYRPSACAICKSGRKLDAIINSEGYTKI